MENTSGVSRRKVVSGIAWSVPAVTAVAAAPFAVASPTCDPATAWLNWLSSSAAPAGNSGVTVGYNPEQEQFTLSGYAESVPSSYEEVLFAMSDYAALVTYADGSTSTVGSWPLDTSSEVYNNTGQEIMLTGDALQPLSEVVSITVAGYTRVSISNESGEIDIEIDQNLTEYTFNPTTCMMSGTNNFRVYNDVCDPVAVWSENINDGTAFFNSATDEDLEENALITTYSNGVLKVTTRFNDPDIDLTLMLGKSDGTPLEETIPLENNSTTEIDIDLMKVGVMLLQYYSESDDRQGSMGATLLPNCVLIGGGEMKIRG